MTPFDSATNGTSPARTLVSAPFGRRTLLLGGLS